MENGKSLNTVQNSAEPENFLPMEEVYSDSLSNRGLDTGNPQARFRSIALPITATTVHLLDQVLEGTFSFADVSTLKQCRLVNWRFCKFGTKEIVKRTWIKLYLKPAGGSPIHNENFQEILNLRKLPSPLQTKNHDKDIISTISRGLSFLYSKYYALFWTPTVSEDEKRVSGSHLSNLLRLVKNSPHFPCEDFDLKTRALQAPTSQQILTAIGVQLRKLDLKLNFSAQTVSLDESRVMTCLSKLLIVQAPNLSAFLCNVMLPESGSLIQEWDDSMAEYGRNPNVHFFNPVDASGKKPILKNLTCFRVLSAFWGKVFYEIMEAGINLKTVSATAEDTCTEKKMLEYFLGKNKQRIKILKSIGLFFSSSTITMYERVVSQHSWNIQLSFIHVSFFPPHATETDYKKRITNVINSILKSSTAQLKMFSTHPLRSLSGIEIPPMPILKSFVFYEWANTNEIEDRFKYYFPQKFNMAEKCSVEELLLDFPKNHSLNTDFFRYLDLPQPVLSIKRIYAPGDLSKIPVLVRDFAFRLFPNAVFLPIDSY